MNNFGLHNIRNTGFGAGGGSPGPKKFGQKSIAVTVPGFGFGTGGDGDSTIGNAKNCYEAELLYLEITLQNRKGEVVIEKCDGQFLEVKQCLAWLDLTCVVDKKPLKVGKRSVDITIKATGEEDKEIKKCDDCEYLTFSWLTTLANDHHPTSTLFEAGGAELLESLTKFADKVCDKDKPSTGAESLEIECTIICLKDKTKGCKDCDEKKIIIYGVNDKNTKEKREIKNNLIAQGFDPKDIDFDLTTGYLASDEFGNPQAIPKEDFCNAFGALGKCLAPPNEENAMKLAYCWNDVADLSKAEKVALFAAWVAGDIIKYVMNWVGKCICK